MNLKIFLPLMFKIKKKPPFYIPNMYRKMVKVGLKGDMVNCKNLYFKRIKKKCDFKTKPVCEVLYS